ncbi:hypothetical protein BC832DRAFT_380199 [Gaertneriomyces semiglobifer]|nr:hypothetical protein BC832DRAFT_380199 [Gaertneriomyces semiglobifer]
MTLQEQLAMAMKNRGNLRKVTPSAEGSTESAPPPAPAAGGGALSFQDQLRLTLKKRTESSGDQPASPVKADAPLKSAEAPAVDFQSQLRSALKSRSTVNRDPVPKKDEPAKNDEQPGKEVHSCHLLLCVNKEQQNQLEEAFVISGRIWKRNPEMNPRRSLAVALKRVFALPQLLRRRQRLERKTLTGKLLKYPNGTTAMGGR